MEYKPITRTRGDTYPFTVTFRTDAGALVDLTGASFILTVNAEEDPVETQLPEFSLVGVVAAPLTGVVEFTMSESDADRFGLFYYDIQMTDAQGYIRTMMRGTFEMRQDITKNPIYIWTADGKSAVDGSDGLLFLRQHVNDAGEYITRDNVRVLRCTFAAADSGSFRYVVPDWPTLNLERPFRFSGLVYMDASWYSQTSLSTAGFSAYHSLYIENEPGYRSVNVGGHWPHTDGIISYKSSWSAQLSIAEGWIRFAFAWEPTTLKMSGKAWNADEDEPDWQAVTEDGEEKPLIDGITQTGQVAFGFATLGVGNAEIAWLKYEVLP